MWRHNALWREGRYGFTMKTHISPRISHEGIIILVKFVRYHTCRKELIAIKSVIILDYFMPIPHQPKYHLGPPYRPWEMILVEGWYQGWFGKWHLMINLPHFCPICVIIIRVYIHFITSNSIKCLPSFADSGVFVLFKFYSICKYWRFSYIMAFYTYCDDS